jgi:hypothetical protein
VGTEKRREKVVVLRELHRAIIYTTEMSKQLTEGYVSTASIQSWQQSSQASPKLRFGLLGVFAWWRRNWRLDLGIDWGFDGLVSKAKRKVRADYHRIRGVVEGESIGF